ncbi:Uncharacterized protein TCM_015715 [Theobroma cacao]|uniref:Uncharacterized protein n=1 Tax=Theobroma cacao TaxID=3641 RepID=A0A061G2A1_THECC|nr:Uncharacterized protein TCM_015715 [Theobroma cacao]
MKNKNVKRLDIRRALFTKNGSKHVNAQGNARNITSKNGKSMWRKEQRTPKNEVNLSNKSSECPLVYTNLKKH